MNIIDFVVAVWGAGLVGFAVGNFIFKQTISSVSLLGIILICSGLAWRFIEFERFEKINMEERKHDKNKRIESRRHKR